MDFFSLKHERSVREDRCRVLREISHPAHLCSAVCTVIALLGFRALETMSFTMRDTAVKSKGYCLA